MQSALIAILAHSPMVSHFKDILFYRSCFETVASTFSALAHIPAITCLQLSRFPAAQALLTVSQLIPKRICYLILGKQPAIGCTGFLPVYPGQLTFRNVTNLLRSFLPNGETKIAAISLEVTPAFNRLTFADRRSFTYIYMHTDTHTNILVSVRAHNTQMMSHAHCQTKREFRRWRNLYAPHSHTSTARMRMTHSRNPAIDSFRT